MPIKFSDIFGSAQESFNNEKLEEVFNKTKDVAESVSKKSAERIELSRKRVELFDAKAKLSKLYEKYGKLQYGIRIGDEIGHEVLTDYENQIAELREKIDIYTKDIEEAKEAFNESMSQAAKRTRDAFCQDGKEVQADGAVDVTVSGEDITVEGEPSGSK
ncbi:MAG: hypothetical protein ACI4V4_06165 [Eubacterium sp.]